MPASPGPVQAGLSAACTREIDELARSDRLRETRSVQPQASHIVVDGKTLLNLSSNDYLGLSQHPNLIQAAMDATQRFGVGAGASRLVSGTQRIHTELEERFAAFKHAQAALLLPTGYTANLAVLTTLAKPGDLVLIDKLVHASLIDAAKSSGADVRSFPHLKLDRADQLLSRHKKGRRFVVTDSVFSMDGDCADLPALCDLADRHNASLIVDEAHSTGVLGDDGSGLASAQGVGGRVYTCGTGGIVVSTASKALGSLGGLITASKPIIDLLINKARQFIYSTAVPPAQVASINAALDVIEQEPDRRNDLIRISRYIRDQLVEKNWLLPTNESAPTPIIPLIIGSEEDTLETAAHLEANGIFVPAIRPPTVAKGQSRLRLSVRADMTPQDVATLLRIIGKSTND